MKPMDKSFHSNFWLIEVSSDLDILKGHLKHIEEQVEQWRQSAEGVLDTLSERQPSPSPNGPHPWSQFAHEIHDNYVEFRLPRILYNPFLVSLYTVYESAVTEVARLIQEKKGQEISLDDIRGSDFPDRAKKYYQHILMFELPQNDQSWERLKILADLRHAITHANGRLSMVKESRRKKIREWMERDIGIEDYYGDIIVSQSFVRETFDIVKDSLEDLLKRYSELDRIGRSLMQASQG